MAILFEGKHLPTLKELIVSNPPNVPSEAAWIWGPEDDVGRLNLLTPNLVRNVLASESTHGLVSSLNWDISLPRDPLFNRPALHHETKELGAGSCIHDDTIIMNTQSGSQFDGLRHFGHLSKKVFYNGVTVDQISGDDASKNQRIGIQAASQRGIVGRGVLLDFATWADETGVSYDPFTRRGITLAELKAIASYQKVEFQIGDVLLIRSGWIKKYNTLRNGKFEQPINRQNPSLIGVEQDEDVKEWLHDQYFSLVGGDQPAFEAWPKKTDTYLHEYLLACWGVMIGEMLDLEDLAAKCKSVQKYSFVFTSALFNSPGGVASLANALAII
ncbi:putative cyclase-domain-containing protein [Lipomyces japonicus]|uniref:putative cyclase-domain-containing protein n=1 Tax=Lipomyces japonicus TaxID=56871 RepID=UPI0034CEB185